MMNIPEIIFPGISQKNFEEAFFVLEKCKVTDVPAYGFIYPFFAPGGRYGAQWWQLDSSLAICGYKWADQKFAEDTVRNFILSQCNDGRIRLWGFDTLPYGEHHSKQRDGVSSLPKLFCSAYETVIRSGDYTLAEETYQMFSRYLKWWFSNRLDKETGLISAVFEETFVPYLGVSGEYAPVDTNMEVAAGCDYTARLAEYLHKKDEIPFWQNKVREIQNAVNIYLWNEEQAAYFPYLIKEKKQVDFLMASAFQGLRLNSAPKERKSRLLRLITDSSAFNWDDKPLTSVSMKDRRFTVTTGEYQFNASWSGNIWTLINEGTVRSLLDSGEYGLAAYLAHKTVLIFNNNYTEFADPIDGSGQGVREYAWTASQYIALLIEVIFGIHYNAFENTVTIEPHLDSELKNEKLYLHRLFLPDDSILDVDIDFRSDKPVQYRIYQSQNNRNSVKINIK